jgi:thymidylate synthase (FAD)
MGDDLTVVNAARVSFDKESEWENITPAGPIDHLLTEKDTKLINYLANHNHFTPFTHCTITMRETVPIFVARQRFKHTIGFSYNEVSRRYVDDTPEFYTPDTWRGKADNVKQGSSEKTIEGAPELEAKAAYKNVIEYCQKEYEWLMDLGVCPEQARMVLPQSMYTSYYVTGSLYAWARAYNLRSDSHAQKEIQFVAKYWDTIIKELFPTSWEALTNE